LSSLCVLVVNPLSDAYTLPSLQKGIMCTVIFYLLIG
jgi:hypothetical protein